MSIVEQAVDLQNRVLDRIRDRRAFEAAGEAGTARDFESLRSSRQCLVVSFRRSGEPVPTAVNFGLSPDGRLYFRSEPRSGKVRRIRRDPHVRVCACNLRAKPTGPVAEGRARVVPETEAERAEAVVAGNWSHPMRVLERGLDRMPVEIVYVEVEPAPDSVMPV